MRVLEHKGIRYTVTRFGVVSEVAKKRLSWAQSPGYDEPPPEEAVMACLRWLEQCAKPAKRRSYSSYWLKHVVEEWCGDYIPNGAMIEAAIRAGYRVEPYGPTNPNCAIWLVYTGGEDAI
ncbi:MAG: hypothetical protein NZ765_07475 [Anaerolineae bacterium]|nr:hypothetical protein [Anaerolineae bacterium]